MEEPIQSKNEKKINEKEIRKMEKILLEKHFEGRKYTEDKIKKWSDNIIEEMNEYLLTNYSSYGFSIFLFVGGPISYYTSRQAIFDPNNDSSMTEKYETIYLNATLRVFIIKIRNLKCDFENINIDYLLKINKIFNETLESKSFIDKKINSYLENAVNEINSYLIKFDDIGSSFQQGFLFKSKTKNIHFYYKFTNMKFIPYYASYANDSILAHLFLFFVGK